MYFIEKILFFIDNINTFNPYNSNLLKMRKTILGALVVFFVTCACLLAINEVSSSSPDDQLQQYYSAKR